MRSKHPDSQRDRYDGGFQTDSCEVEAETDLVEQEQQRQFQTDSCEVEALGIDHRKDGRTAFQTDSCEVEAGRTESEGVV